MRSIRATLQQADAISAVPQRIVLVGQPLPVLRPLEAEKGDHLTGVVLLHAIALGTVRLDGVGQQLLQTPAGLRARALVHQTAYVHAEQAIIAENRFDANGCRAERCDWRCLRLRCYDVIAGAQQDCEQYDGRIGHDVAGVFTGIVCTRAGLDWGLNTCCTCND